MKAAIHLSNGRILFVRQSRDELESDLQLLQEARVDIVCFSHGGEATRGGGRATVYRRHVMYISDVDPEQV